MLLDKQMQEEIDHVLWKQFWAENPDADPVKVMCAITVAVWVSGMLMCTVLLIVAGIAWFFGML